MAFVHRKRIERRLNRKRKQRKEKKKVKENAENNKQNEQVAGGQPVDTGQINIDISDSDSSEESGESEDSNNGVGKRWARQLRNNTKAVWNNGDKAIEWKE